ncbi:MAG: molybdopterin-dependent oxidoreductase [Saprospiraceae bacterium]
MVQKKSHSHQVTKSTCCYCGVGCGITIAKDVNGNIEVAGDESHPVNKGMLCSKGLNLHHTVNNKKDRLLYPEMRYHRNLPRVRVNWDTALDHTAAVFKTLIQNYGPDSVAFYASGQCLTEEYYVVNKLMKGFIGSNNIDTNSRLCMSSAVVGYKMSLGEDCVPVSYDDIELCDVIFVAGGNPAYCHPILWKRVEIAKEKNPHLKIIISDPRKTQSCSIANLHLQVHPGTDVTLHHAIGRCIIEKGDIDIDFLHNHTQGFYEYKLNVFERTIAEASAICEIPEEDIRLAASMIGNAKGLITMWTMGLNQSVIGVNKNLSLINLNLITGQIGKPGAGPFSLTGQPNAMGGREVGGLSNLLPAHRELSNEDHRNEVEQFWQIPLGTIQSKAGLTATEMFEALEKGSLKAIWILCTNPLISLPDVRRAEAALQQAKFVVVQDISNTVETLSYADVVLPAASWAEKEGTMTNAGRYISHLGKSIDAPGEALPDSEIICRFAKKMGYYGFDFNTPEEIFKEHAALTKGTSIDISALDYSILKEKRTVQWPYLHGSETKRLLLDKKFYTVHQKAIIHAVDDINHSESIGTSFPLILTTGRIRDQWHTRSRTGKVNKLNQHIKSNYLEIHPVDAEIRGIQQDSIVDIFNARGNLRVKVKISKDIKQGVVFLPMHWGKILNSDLHRTNNLTHSLVDPKSKEPDFKYSAVQVKLYNKTKQKIIVIGAGAGAYGFVKSYRSLNSTDEIEIFSKEDHPFYNRVLLPEYINGSQTWDKLVKMDDSEEYESNIKLHRGVSVQQINESNKTIVDHQGIAHRYDILILSMGSSAALLRDIPDFKGIFTMRSRDDADLFIQYLDISKGKVIIVGGGLLGIELAAAIIERGVHVTIVQRISRLMDRQLDSLGSQLLHEALTERGVDILYNDEIDRWLGEKQIQSVRLKSGLSIDCQAIIIAVGTSPNIELAKSADIECKRGVVVDEYLRTSTPDTFAIGEIAEYNGFLYGITAAAEQQAEVVAKYLSGDIAEYYSGSLVMNILKMHDFDVCSLGQIEHPRDDPEYEIILFIDKAKRYYKKCIVYKDRLIGAILIGDKTEFLELRDLIANKTELSEKRIQLLRSGKSSEPMFGKLVCSCNQVGDMNLIQKINNGCEDLVQLCQLTGAGMGCGSCRTEVKGILQETLNASKSIIENITL